MDKFEVGLLILFVMLISWLYFGITHTNSEWELACQELGFESYEFIADMNYCEDTEGNLHYINMECKPWYWVECTAKPISVGDVRVK